MRGALAAGASVRARDAGGATALVQAAYGNHLPVARALVEAGADVNAKDETQQSAYLIATSEVGDDPRLLELTLANGARVDDKDSFNGTGLIRAAERGHARVVERLLAAGIDRDHVNRLGWTALLEAVILGDGGERHLRTVRALVRGGVDVDVADGGRACARSRTRASAATRRSPACWRPRAPAPDAATAAAPPPPGRARADLRRRGRRPPCVRRCGGRRRPGRRSRAGTRAAPLRIASSVGRTDATPAGIVVATTAASACRDRTIGDQAAAGVDAPRKSTVQPASVMTLATMRAPSVCSSPSLQPTTARRPDGRRPPRPAGDREEQPLAHRGGEMLVPDPDLPPLPPVPDRVQRGRDEPEAHVVGAPAVVQRALHDRVGGDLVGGQEAREQIREPLLRRLAPGTRRRRAHADDSTPVPRAGQGIPGLRAARPSWQGAGMATDHDAMLRVALDEARLGLEEGGIPIGSALFDASGTLLGRGHNRRVQAGDPSAHAEVDAFRAAGRRPTYRDTVMVTTLAPCWYCSGLIRQFAIPVVVVGESRTFTGGVELAARARRPDRGLRLGRMRGPPGGVHRAPPGGVERGHRRLTDDQLRPRSCCRSAS